MSDPHSIQPNPLPRSFYDRSALVVARELLGTRLIRLEPGQPPLIGIIVETEAYTGHDDLASHGRNKETPRNKPMWGAPGHAYVYLSRGIHWMLNAVTEAEGAPAAVLIRAVRPIAGHDVIARRRAKVKKPRETTSGPARLTMAFGIDQSLNTCDLTTPAAGLWIEAGEAIPDSRVLTGPRIGMGKTPEPWYSMPWRWYVADDEYVSR